MAETTIIKLNAQEREADKNPRQLRSAGFVPATVYGKGMESKNIMVCAHEFEMATRNNRDAVIELQAGKDKFKVVIQELQINYSTNQVLNIEFKLV
ncbi:TPA: hypothetical protein IAA68_03690 [Candidatus Galligastranaerophilus faecipullorum]|nr:hypothetical protein [Candidatus Galligastranaerophilus faecipullorum]